MNSTANVILDPINENITSVWRYSSGGANILDNYKLVVDKFQVNRNSLVVASGLEGEDSQRGDKTRIILLKILCTRL